MNTLQVQPAKTETTPGEFVTDGYRIVVLAEGHAMNGKGIYQSRFANKAMAKAFVLLGTEFPGFAVTVSDAEVATEAGKKNLELMLDADRFRHIRHVATATPPVEEMVQAYQATDGAAVEMVADAIEAHDKDSDSD